MRSEHAVSSPSTAGQPLTFVLGVLAGLGTAAVGLLGRKAYIQAGVGHGHTLKHRALDFASSVMQPKYPLEAISTYLNAFHFYADDMGRQVEAHHFCTHLSHDMHQCVIYDSNRPGARLIGIEYIISAERFRALPLEEKRLWHSHHYEVKSGELIAPGIPQWAEHAYFADLASTYGKTFHMWQIDRDDFPYGVPQLMMGFTSDGQANRTMLADRDARFGISSQRRKQARADIPMPYVEHAANAWETGRTVQTRAEEVAVRR